MKCAICGKEINGYGNNPYPVRLAENARCCDECNTRFVVPARFILMSASTEQESYLKRLLNSCSEKRLLEIL